MAVNINVPSQVKTYANLAAFPATGALKTIYIAEDTNKTYRWTGSVYTEISASAAMTWGQIGGTLSNQTDLQNALDAKVPTSRTLTINGVTQDLSANRTFTISTGITIGSTAIASGTVGRVLFEGAGNVVQESAQLSWDNTNNALLVTTGKTFSGYSSGGSASDALKLELSGNGAVLGIQNSNALGFSGVEYLSNTGAPRVFTGFNNSNGQEFRFNNFATGGYIDFLIGGTSGLRIANTRNILINTTTDAGFRLDVNGTARVQGNAQFGTGFYWDNTNGRLGIGISTPTFPLDILGSLAGSSFGFKLRNSASNGYTEINCFNNSGGLNDRMYMGVGGTTTGDAFQNRGYFFSGSNLEGINFTANKTTTGDIRFFTGGVNERLRIHGSGNVLINTTTDAGFRLDVNGTARVSGAATLAGTNTLSGTTNVSGLSSNWICQYPSNATVKPLSFSAQSGGATSNNVAIQFGFNFRESGGLFTQDIFQNILYDNTTNNVVTGFEWYTHQTQAGSNPSVLAMALRGKTLSIGTNTPNASAVLQADSTTQGFLPPRMTTTQKNAIATPAAGLVVYDTTLNKLCVYTTAWETVTSL